MALTSSNVLTMLDIAKQKGTDPAVGLIEENLTWAPEFSILPARAVAGTTFKVPVRTAWPTVSFRQPNGSSAPVKSTYEQKQISLGYIDAQLQIDNAVAMASDVPAEVLLAREEVGAVRGAMIKFGTCVWYGTDSTLGDANAFPGALDVYDSTNNVVDAAGTTSSTGSSVWLVVALPSYMEAIAGQNTPFALGQWRKQQVSGISCSGVSTSWVNSLEAWLGVAFYNKYALVRIKNLTADSGKGLTDSLLAQAIEKFPVGTVPTHIFMSRRSRRQLQVSRTVTLFGNGNLKPSGGLATVAPIPTEYDGIPIIATDSILNTEAIA